MVDDMRAIANASWLVWLSIVAAIVLLGEFALGTLAANAVPTPDPRYNLDFAFGMQLPVRVVNDVPGGSVMLVVFWVVVAALAAAGWKLARAAESDASVTMPKLLAAMAAIGILLTFFPITFAGDPYAYVAFGRLYGLYKINPYQVGGPVDVTSDPTLAQCLRFYGNPPVGDNYGPLWTLFAGALARLTQAWSLYWQVWAERAVALAAALIAAAGVARVAVKHAPESWKRGVVLFAFHPVVLYEAAAEAHNDSIMLAFGVWAFALVAEYPLYAGLLLGAACAVKYVAVIAAPFLFVRAWKTSGIGSAVIAILCGAAVPILAFVPFWVGASSLASLFAETSESRTSPTWLVDALVGVFGGNSIQLFGLTPERLISSVVALTLAVVVGWSIVGCARSWDSRHVYVWRSIAALIYALPNIYPWYTMWISPAIALGGRWGSFAYWLGLLTFLHYAQDAGRQPSGGAYVYALEGMVAVTMIALGVPIVIARRAALE